MQGYRLYKQGHQVPRIYHIPPTRDNDQFTTEDIW